MATNTCELRDYAQKNCASSSEAERRAAVSRAYYAAFHDLAEAFFDMVDTRDLGEHGLPSHAVVARCFRQFSSKAPDRKKAMAHGAEAVNLLNVYVAIKRARGIADYALGMSTELSPRDVVVHLGRVDRLRKFAAKIK